ncbi:hypothetical protein [Streptomyces sp. NPDC054783]
MDSGKRLWKTLGTSQCRDSAHAGGGALPALVKRGDSSAPTCRAEKPEPGTGKPKDPVLSVIGVGTAGLKH